MKRSVFLFLLFALSSIYAHAADWPPVSPEDLSMVSIKEQPGAPAVILLREEVDDDLNSDRLVYERIKVLTDAGREYANVEIPYSRRHFTVSAVSGRTIHADGSIVPFEGKPFDKTVLKGKDIRINVKSFTLPDVQVGSIIEYRYRLDYDDRHVSAPEWRVQTDLFQRKAYFKFIPFQNHGNVEILLDHGQISTGIAWTPFLSEGPQLQIHQLPRTSLSTVHEVGYWVDLTRENIPALIKEPFSPPEFLLRQRVYFYYQQSLKPDDYWKSEAKYWNKNVDGFIGKDRGIADAVKTIVLPSDSAEQKVKKIYSFVSSLENQDYIPERTAQEQKVLELKINNGAEDVLEHRSGTHDELNRLFVAMVRAAGIPASLIWVPDRSEEVFIKQYMSTRQFDAEVAIVQLDSKEVYLDPGTKFCPYGILDWRYSGVEGLREGGKGAQVAQTPYSDFKQAIETRMARVSLDPHGTLSGAVSLVFKGQSAMLRRQQGGKTDAEGRKKLLEDELRAMLPGNSEVSLTGSPDWQDPEKPLVAEFHISCPFATLAGKRLMVAQQLFQTNDKARFPASTRSYGVYFEYPWQEADEIYITLPAGFELESLAPDDTVKLEYAVYKVQHQRLAPNQIFSRRDFIVAANAIPKDHYNEIKGFFDKVKADDDQPALVRLTASVATN